MMNRCASICFFFFKDNPVDLFKRNRRDVMISIPIGNVATWDDEHHKIHHFQYCEVFGMTGSMGVSIVFWGTLKKDILDLFLTRIKNNLWRGFTGSLIFRHTNVPFLINILNEMIVVIQCFRILAAWHFPIEKGQNHTLPAGRSWATRKVGDIYME